MVLLTYSEILNIYSKQNEFSGKWISITISTPGPFEPGYRV